MNFFESKLTAKKFLENSQGDYNYHNLQIDLPELTDDLLNIQSQINSEDIYIDPEDNSLGLEDEIHITACYGIKKEDQYFDIRRFLQTKLPIQIIFGNISFFINEDKPYDVLKIDIISPELEAIHYELRELFDPYVSFPEYHPHMTIGYIKKGSCQDLEGICDLTNNSRIIDTLIFSHCDKFKLDLPLNS